MDTQTRTTGGRLSRLKHSPKLAAVESCAMGMSFNSCIRPHRLISLPTMLLPHLCPPIKNSQRGLGTTFRVITIRFSTSTSMARTKANPSGARAVTFGSSIYRPRCRSGHIVSSCLTGLSASKKSMETRTPWIAAQFGMLTKLSLLEVCSCSIVSLTFLITTADGEDVSARNSAQQAKTPKRLGFFSKYLELQLLMLQHNAGLTASHPYSSPPLNWPFLLSGISFWTQSEGQKQIYLIGNIIGWW